MVAIDAERLKVALEWWAARSGDRKRPSSRRVAAELTRLLRRPADNPFRYSLIESYLGGKTKRCHAEVRVALAKLVGRPITPEFLGGEEPLQIPPLRPLPSGIGFGGQGEMPAEPLTKEHPLPPRYELEAMKLGKHIEKRAQVTNHLGMQYPAPDLTNAIRWMLMLAFWREHLFVGQSWGASRAQMEDESTEFAEYLSGAITVLLRPWFEGRAELRPRMLRRIAARLDAVMGENWRVYSALQVGALADVALIDLRDGRPAPEPYYDVPQLKQEAKMLAQIAAGIARDRASGIPEAEIARRTLGGVPALDDA